MPKEISDFDFSSFSDFSYELEEYFRNNFKAYDYKNENWDELLTIVHDGKNKLESSETPKRDFVSIINQMYEVPTVKKEISKTDSIFANIIAVFSAIGHVAYTVFDKTKFIFAIPGITIASVVFMKFIMIILETFIFAFLPKAITPLMLESIVACIIFILLNVSIFVDSFNRDVLYSSKAHFLRFLIPLPFYCLIFILFRDVRWVEDFGYNFFIFLYPHLWISSFTGEYLISGIVSLCFNCFVSVGFSYLLRIKLTSVTDTKKNKKSKKNNIQHDNIQHDNIIKDDNIILDDNIIENEKNIKE